MKSVLRWSLFGVGWLSLLLGVFGIFLPLLPTTPFVLLSACCFSKSSERFHGWLLQHRFFGPIILDWQSQGVIRLRVKITTTFLVVSSVIYCVFFKDIHWLAKISTVLICTGSLTFVWTRPSRRSFSQSLTPNESLQI